MFIAIDEKGNRITVEEIQAGEKYFCPVCHAPVIIKAQNSYGVKTHFSHQRGTQCLDDWKYDMSEWHYKWQECFPVEQREITVQTEDACHRADAILCNTVFEFQHSPLSFEEFTNRNQFYLKCGYDIVWIFDATKKVKNPEIMLEPPCCNNDLTERHLKWKRKQDIFKKFNYPPNAKIAIYLEVEMQNREEKILIPLKNIDPLFPTAHFCVPVISPKNLLKEYRLINNEKILSISEIIENTRAVREKYAQRFRGRFF
ncbi:MAG: hypothetical protein IJ426_06640 [Clostridia bacterium]|nr:hypothetical protein [Clostridia bacterium]